MTHTPVMAEEVMRLLAPTRESALLIDGTVGEGGHAELFLERFGNLMVIGVDADKTIQGEARKRLKRYGDRVTFRNCWTDTYLENYPESCPPHRIFLDLGLSSFHYQKGGRGFSFQRDEPLDMRLGEDSCHTAAEILTTWKEDALAEMLYEKGEERYAKRIARAIVHFRKRSPLTRTTTLVEIIRKAVPASYNKGRINPATRTFLALRMAINQDLVRLRRMLAHACHLLEVEGRLGVITFHSLEDREVKHFFRAKSKLCSCPEEMERCQCGGKKLYRLVTKRPQFPSAEEIERNAPSRSAKLRVLQKEGEEIVSVGRMRR